MIKSKTNLRLSRSLILSVLQKTNYHHSSEGGSTYVRVRWYCFQNKLTLTCYLEIHVIHQLKWYKRCNVTILIHINVLLDCVFWKFLWPSNELIFLMIDIFGHSSINFQAIVVSHLHFWKVQSKLCYPLMKKGLFTVTRASPVLLKSKNSLLHYFKSFITKII